MPVETIDRLRSELEAESARVASEVDDFFARLLATLEEGGGNATALLRMLRAAVAEQPEADEARPEEGLEDAVSISTIHTAKGLDWEHVYLAQLHKQGVLTDEERAYLYSDGFGRTYPFDGSPAPLPSGWIDNEYAYEGSQPHAVTSVQRREGMRQLLGRWTIERWTVGHWTIGRNRELQTGFAGRDE